MPRGIKGSTDFDTQITNVDAKIERYTAHIQALKIQRQALVDQKCDSEMKQLYAYMQSMNLSPQEVLTRIRHGRSIIEV